MTERRVTPAVHIRSPIRSRSFVAPRAGPSCADNARRDWEVAGAGFSEWENRQYLSLIRQADVILRQRRRRRLRAGLSRQLEGGDGVAGGELRRLAVLARGIG